MFRQANLADEPERAENPSETGIVVRAGCGGRRGALDSIIDHLRSTFKSKLPDNGESIYECMWRVYIYEEIQNLFQLYASPKPVKIFYEVTTSGRDFSSFLCYKMYEKTRVQLKTSLSHILFQS